MKKTLSAIAFAGISVFAVAADKYFKSSGNGYWSDASNWYTDKNCSVPANSIPANGDTATISLGSSAVISEGDWIEGVTISVPNSSSDFAKLAMDGGTVTNCNITIGSTGNAPENGKQALFTMSGGTIEGMFGSVKKSLTIENGGKFLQTGGLIHQYQGSVTGWYDHVGGTNAIRGGAFYINVTKSETRGYHIGDNAVVATWLAYNKDNEISSLKGDVFKNVPVSSDSDAVRIEVPNNNNSAAKLTISETETKLPTLWIALKRNGGTQTQTGIVEIASNSKIHFTDFGNLNFYNTNSYSAFIAKDSTVSNFTFGVNGTKADVLSGQTRFDIVFSNSVVCSSALDPVNDYEGYLAYVNNDTTIGRAVSLTVADGAQYYAGLIYMNGGSKLTIDGGFLETATILANEKTADFASVPHSIVVRNGGVLMSSVANNRKGSNCSCRYYFGSRQNEPTVNPSFFLLDDGNFHKRDNTYGEIKLGCPESQNVTRFEVRGKSSMRDLKEDSIEPKGFYVNVGASNCAEFVFKGGEHDINLSSLGDSEHRYLLEFIADKSAGNIAPVIFHRNNNSQDCGGDLRISLDGNVLLTTNESFEIIKRTKSKLCTNFHSLPEDAGSTLWSVERTERTASAVLADSLATLGDGAMFTPENPLAMGSVGVKIRATNDLVRVAFELSLKAADGTTSLSAEELETLASELENAGYTGSSVKNGNLYVNFPLDLVEPQTTYRFVWDFTKTNGAKDLDNVTTKAKVTAVRSAVVYRNGFQLIIR